MDMEKYFQMQLRERYKEREKLMKELKFNQFLINQHKGALARLKNSTELKSGASRSANLEDF